MNSLISVIVPIYNVEAHLNKCIESITSQTYTSLEIILVDDGSTDSCPTLCDKWAKQDKRIKVIHKKNGGQSDARNAGLKIASGELIGFVDSDDWIDTQMYEHMVSALTENNADIAECCFFYCEDINAKFPEQAEEKLTVFDKENAVKCLLNESYFKSTAPNKLLKKKIAVDVEFETGKVNEDILWSYYAVSKANKVVHTNRQLYAYYQRQGSTMNSPFTKKRLDGIYATEKRAQEVKRDFPKLYPLAARTYIGLCFYSYRKLCRAPKTKETQELKKILFSLYKSGDIRSALSDMKTHHKIYHTAFRIAPSFTSFIMNKMKKGL